MKWRGGEILAWWERHERVLAFFSTLFGFCFDLIIAKRPDSIFVNWLLLSYLLAAATLIIFLNSKARQSAAAEGHRLFYLLVLQFCFGGLASNLLILYGRSGTPAGNLLFVAVLLGILVGNEFMRTRYEAVRFNIGVYYLLLLTYCIIAVPTFILHGVGTVDFFISAGVSLGVMALFLFTLWRITRVFQGAAGEALLRGSSAIVLGILVVFSGLYYFNLIPPVPLALKGIGIYHSVQKDSADTYSAQYEPAPWWEFWQSTSGTYTYVAGGSAYCFSSVFAPTGLATPVRHEWDFYDPNTKKWEPLAEVSFPISGGRSGGYRGFSVKYNLIPGRWRCSVQTGSGKLIGQFEFTVVAATSTPVLTTVTL